MKVKLKRVWGHGTGLHEGSIHETVEPPPQHKAETARIGYIWIIAPESGKHLSLYDYEYTEVTTENKKKDLSAFDLLD